MLQFNAKGEALLPVECRLLEFLHVRGLDIEQKNKTHWVVFFSSKADVLPVLWEWRAIAEAHGDEFPLRIEGNNLWVYEKTQIEICA